MTAVSLPGTATFEDNGDGTGDFSWTPGYDDADVYEVTFAATDDSLVSDEEIVLITVENVNRPPSMTAPATADADVDVEVVFEVLGADPDGTIPALSASNLPTGAEFNDSLDGSGWFIWTPTLSDVGVHEIVFTAFDGDLSHSDTTYVTVHSPSSCCDLAGDFNNSGGLDISDLTAIVDYMFDGGPPADCPDEADMNASCTFDISDLTYYVDYMFNAGPVPVCGCVE